MRYPFATSASLEGHSQNHQAAGPEQSDHQRFFFSRELVQLQLLTRSLKGGAVTAMSPQTYAAAGVSIPAAHCGLKKAEGSFLVRQSNERYGWELDRHIPGTSSVFLSPKMPNVAFGR